MPTRAPAPSNPTYGQVLASGFRNASAWRAANGTVSTSSSSTPVTYTASSSSGSAPAPYAPTPTGQAAYQATQSSSSGAVYSGAGQNSSYWNPATGSSTPPTPTRISTSQQLATQTLMGGSTPQQQVASSLGLQTSQVNPQVNAPRPQTISSSSSGNSSSSNLTPSQIIQQGNVVSQVTLGETVTPQQAKSLQPVKGVDATALNPLVLQSEFGIDKKGFYGGSASNALVTPSDLLLYYGVAQLGVAGARVAGSVAYNAFSNTGFQLPNILGMGARGAINVAGKSPELTVKELAAQHLKSTVAGEMTAKQFNWLKSLGLKMGEQGAVNFGGGFGSMYSSAGSVAKDVGAKVLGSSLGRGAILFGTALATPEVTVAVTGATTKKPAINLDQSQWEQIYGAGFSQENIGQSFTSQEYSKTYPKPGAPDTMVTETGKTYTPRTDVGFNISVPFIGQFTPYSVFPSVAVDVFTGGVATKSFKEGAKTKALELGLSDAEATQASEYAWTTQGEARSRGELLGIIPATIAGEELGQALVGGAVKTGLVKAGISQAGKGFVYATGAKAGESAVTEAGKVVFNSALKGLIIPGIAEGGTFGYLMGQAQGQKDLQLAGTVAFSAATGGISAPVLGAPIAKWAITRPITSKIGMGLLYIADYSEAPGDIGAKLLGKAADKALVKTFTPTTTFNFGVNPTFTPSTTEKQVKSTWTPTYTPTPTNTNTNVSTITGVPVTTPTSVTTPTNTTVNNYTDTFTNTETPVYTITNTNTFTSTPTNTTTPTFTPNIPLIPFFGLPGGPATGEGRKSVGKRKYYNELDAAFAGFGEADFLAIPFGKKVKKKVRKRRR